MKLYKYPIETRGDRKRVKDKKRKKNQEEWIENSNEYGRYSFVSISTLNINGLNRLIKRQSARVN